MSAPTAWALGLLAGAVWVVMASQLARGHLQSGTPEFALLVTFPGVVIFLVLRSVLQRRGRGRASDPDEG